MTVDLAVRPDKGTYLPGEPVNLHVDLGEGTVGGTVEVGIWHLDRLVAELAAVAEDDELTLTWQPPGDFPRGYGVEMTALTASGSLAGRAGTAFDVLEDWTRHPRYAFLSEFAPGRADTEEVIRELTRFHVNGIQFYDWMYRHDDPVSPDGDFEDLLGRHLSEKTIRALARAARRAGMAPMAYMAIYAASLDWSTAHPESALYDDEGRALVFGDQFLGLMNPSRSSPWSRHLLMRCREILERLPFAGVHLDQYGEPRTAADSEGRAVDLPRAFADFVSDLKESRPGTPVTFNAVKNWPIDELANAPVDFIYVELWPDTPTYRDLASIVSHARDASEGKAVVVAVYIPADHPANVLAANAVIAAHGGSRIEIGEPGRLLTDPYFPDSQSLPAPLRSELLVQADFQVRYGDLIGPGPGWVTPSVGTPPEVWASARRTDGWMAINLVNMSGIESARWDTKHESPGPLSDVPIQLGLEENVERGLWLSPDQGVAEPLQWDQTSARIQLVIPSLVRRGVVALSLRERA